MVTHSATAINAARDFSSAFADLQTTALPAGADVAVSNYYATVFGSAFSRATGKSVDPALFAPTSNAATYLQNAYPVPAAGDFAKAVSVGTAGDPSACSRRSRGHR